jgi:hypothetical protein
MPLGAFVGALAFGTIAFLSYRAPPSADFGSVVDVFRGMGCAGLVGAVAGSVGGGLTGAAIGRMIDQRGHPSA